MKNQVEHISTLLERLARILNNDAGLTNIKPAQWEALRYFARANQFSQKPSDLTAYLGVTKGTVSQTINALERKGLIKKTKESLDRRSVRIVLADEGRKLLDDDPLGALSRSIKQLNSDELDKLAQTLETVVKNALNLRSGTPFGICKTCHYFKRDTSEGTPNECSLLQVPLTSGDSELICKEHTSVAG